jgi:hypothetical protein
MAKTIKTYRYQQPVGRLTARVQPVTLTARTTAIRRITQRLRRWSLRDADY